MWILKQRGTNVHVIESATILKAHSVGGSQENDILLSDSEIN